MKITKDLPFPGCDGCKDFVLKVFDTIQYRNGIGEHIITVSCANCKKCEKLKEEADRRTGNVRRE